MKSLKFNNNAFLYLAAVLVLWLNFSSHLFSTLPLKKFLDGEFPSERFVFSRLVHSLDHGTQSEGGFMLRYEQTEDLYKSVEKEDYAAFKENLPPRKKDIEVYLSHAGVQDDLVFPVWQGLSALKSLILSHAREGSRWHERLQTLDLYYFNMISQSLVALMNALVLGLFVLWTAQKFGAARGWIVLGLAILTLPVLGFFGRSMWWMMWSWFLPMIIVLWSLHLNKRGGPPGWRASLVTGILAGAAIGLKTMMGYEFVSTIMVAAMVPLVFYAVYERWGWKSWLRVSVVIGVCCLAGAIGGFAYHWHVLESAGYDPLAVIRDRFETRAYGGETLNGKNHELQESTQIPFLTVLGGYLVEPKAQLAIPQILLMAPFLIWLIGYGRKQRAGMPEVQKRLWDAFIASIGVSFLGGVSMLLILKGHSYIHGFDIAIWSIPLNLFLLVFYALKLCPRAEQA